MSLKNDWRHHMHSRNEFNFGDGYIQMNVAMLSQVKNLSGRIWCMRPKKHIQNNMGITRLKLLSTKYCPICSMQYWSGLPWMCAILQFFSRKLLHIWLLRTFESKTNIILWKYAPSPQLSETYCDKLSWMLILLTFDPYHQYPNPHPHTHTHTHLCWGHASQVPLSIWHMF